MSNTPPFSEEEIRNLIHLYTSADRNNYQLAKAIVSGYNMDMFDLIDFAGKEEQLFLINDLLQQYSAANYFIKLSPDGILWVELYENYDANIELDLRLNRFISHIVINNKSKEEMYNGSNFDIENNEVYKPIALPVFLQHLTYLKTLALDRIITLQDKALAEPLFNLTQLEALTINAAEYYGLIIPQEIANLTALKSLEINAKYCILPKTFGALKKLERLYIYGSSEADYYRQSILETIAEQNYYITLQKHMSKSMEVLSECTALEELKLDIFEYLMPLNSLGKLEKLQNLTFYVRSTVYNKVPKLIENLKYLQQLTVIPMYKKMNYSESVTTFLSHQSFNFNFELRK